MKAGKFIVALLMCAWFTLSFAILSGEEAYEMPVWRFLAVKCGAMISMILCIAVGRKLERKGLI